MLRDLLLKLYDGDAGIAGVGPNPGVSPQSARDFAARNRWAATNCSSYSLSY